MGRPAITVKYPFAPLAALMGMSEAKACRVLGVRGSTAKKYRAEGMSELVADRMARKAGFVAYECWPEMLDAAIRDAEEADRAAAERHAARVRSYYRRDRERILEAHKAYYEECGDYVRARERAKYRRDREQILAARRERYANDPAYRARKQELRRAYLARKKAQVRGKVTTSADTYEKEVA